MLATLCEIRKEYGTQNIAIRHGIRFFVRRSIKEYLRLKRREVQSDIQSGLRGHMQSVRIRVSKDKCLVRDSSS